MDYKKLNALRERVTAIVLPVVKKNQFQYQSIDPAIQKELAATAAAAGSLLGKAKLVRGAKHQEKLVKLAEKLKDNRTRLEIPVLRAARTALLSTLKAIEAESRNVFIVHGRDEAMRKDVQAALHRFGIDGIVLHEEINKGDTIIEKFDRVARECGYAVVLFSPDDTGGLKVTGRAEQKYAPRARQNVILELGYFVGLLGRKKVFVLVAGNVEKPSDFDGVVYESYDKAGSWRRRLANELTEAGFYIDPSVFKKL